MYLCSTINMFHLIIYIMNEPLYFSSDELFELRWIFDSLIKTSLKEDGCNSNKEIVCCSAFCLSPSRLLSIFRKLNVMSVSSEYRELVKTFVEKFNLNGK